MESFRYGDLEITVESLGERGVYRERGVTIRAPGHPPYAFTVWHPDEAPAGVVAQVVVYDLIEAYEDPLKFLKRRSSPSYLPPELILSEEDREFVRVAGLLREFLQQAHLDVYRDWTFKPKFPQAPIRRKPKEWYPGKKRPDFG